MRQRLPVPLGRRKIKTTIKGEKMKKIVAITAAGLMSFSLVACSGEPEPVPTVTVTEESVPQVESQSSTQDYLDFVNDFGGVYSSLSTESDLISLGETVCEGLDSGLSEDDIIVIMAAALTENDLADEYGSQFGAAIISGATVFLCPASA
jgi:hypothetical protein